MPITIRKKLLLLIVANMRKCYNSITYQRAMVETDKQSNAIVWRTSLGPIKFFIVFNSVVSYNKPFKTKDKYPLPPTMKWSNTLTSIRASDAFKRLVSTMSAFDSVTSPEG